MVNNMGQWKYDPKEPAKTRCNLDDIADIITKKFGYSPAEISIEELSERVLAAIEDEVTNISGSTDGVVYDDNHNICKLFVEGWICDNLPISDFDYKA